MTRSILIGKIHRATVTGADLDYEGSVTLDVDLMRAAGILNHEEIHVWNITNGSRFITYAIEGEAGSGVVCVNGAAAHLTRPGDLVIIAAFAQMTEAEAKAWRPKVARVDAGNRLTGSEAEIPGPWTPIGPRG